MRLLLDTHVLIWTQEESPKLGPNAKFLILDDANDLVISPISTFEVTRLVTHNRLEINKSIDAWLSISIHTLKAATQDITHEIALESYMLPEPFHTDPADRILVATARLHEMTIITADERILAYPSVKTSDARQ